MVPHGQGHLTFSLSDVVLAVVCVLQIYCKEPGNFTPRTAEMRADLGSAATDLSQYQTFDGPIPETVNGR
jgi:hypothetical protein